MSESPRLILASASPIRGELLRRAGLDFATAAAAIDEAEIKASFRADGASVEDCAVILAELKATRVSARHPGALVIGADQMLDLGGLWFDKPLDRAEARRHLSLLRGKTHRLVSAAVVARNGQRLWHGIDEARMTMRDFSEAFLDTYLDRGGESILGSVGAYQIEGAGAALFSRIEGDIFTIQGLPFLPLLAFLREHGAAAR